MRVDPDPHEIVGFETADQRDTGRPEHHELSNEVRPGSLVLTAGLRDGWRIPRFQVRAG